MQARWVSSLARTLVVCACTAALATAGAHATFLRSTDDKDQSDRAEREKGPCSNGPTIPGAVPLDTLKSCGGPTQIEPADSAAKFVQLGPVIVQESQTTTYNTTSIPGITTLTRTFLSRSSSMTDSLKATRPALVAQYAPAVAK